jgi:DNA-binding MarR family transcriptional regulator
MNAADATQARGPDLPPLGLAFDFLRLMWAVDHALQRTSKKMEADLGVTGPQRLVLRIVGRFPGILPGQLAQILHIHPSTLTGVLKRLGRQGLVSKRQDPRDRRRFRLGLTAKGKELAQDAEGTLEAAVQRMLSELPDSTIRNAAEVLARLASLLDPQRGS